MTPGPEIVGVSSRGRKHEVKYMGRVMYDLMKQSIFRLAHDISKGGIIVPVEFIFFTFLNKSIEAKTISYAGKSPPGRARVRYLGRSGSPVNIAECTGRHPVGFKDFQSIETLGARGESFINMLGHA